MYPRIMMWCNMRRNSVGQGTKSVPSPFDGDSAVPYWYDRMAGMANRFANVGITDVLFPNPLMTQSGEYPTADGYGVIDDYDIGSKGRPTRFGNAEKLRRAIAVFHANGINVHIDHVMHQRSGGKNGVYRYNAAGGRNLGRFPKDPGCFRAAGRPIPPFVQVDPVPSPADDFPFGDQLCPVNSQPAHYVWDGLINAGDWLFRTTDADGARVDDMKGMNLGFMNAFMNAKAMQHKFFFGEYASGNRDDTNWWVGAVHGRASAIDFDFHYNMAQRMCMEAGSGHFYMGNLAGRGMLGNNPLKAIPFVESMDSDTNGFATIIFNKALAYALMLSGEGLPQIYIRDYLNEPDCYGMYRIINNMTWIHQMFAHGATVPRYGNHRVYVFERTGYPGLMMALNNDVWNSGWYTVRVKTNWPPGTVLHDYTGHNAQNCTVDHDGYMTFGIPPGADGKGYGAWAPNGHQNKPVVPPPGRSTVQEFEGADDLDTPPLTNVPLTVGRVWCEKNTNISLTMQNTSGLEPDFHCTMAIEDPTNNTLAEATTEQLNHRTTRTGWHSLIATGAEFSPNTRVPFRLRVRYTASRHLPSTQF